MKNEWLSRTELLLGEESLGKIKNAHVLVVGLGGVGAYAAEQICRAGVRKMTIVDADHINTSNINRQLPATFKTLGRNKSEVMQERLRSINPELKLNVIHEFLRPERIPELLEAEHYDYVVDAIDTLTPKINLIYHSLRLNYKIVSSMGAGGKVDPSQIKISDISKSYNCKLARMLRKKLSKRDIYSGFPVVFSPETVDKKAVVLDESENKISNVGTISYMPALFGCFISSVVIRDLIEKPINAN